ncbi:MAG: hypothetical protein AVDCRST_MAG16-2079, partial [uncultured Frankineae bacterium]
GEGARVEVGVPVEQPRDRLPGDGAVGARRHRVGADGVRRLGQRAAV